MRCLPSSAVEVGRVLLAFCLCSVTWNGAAGERREECEATSHPVMSGAFMAVSEHGGFSGGERQRHMMDGHRVDAMALSFFFLFLPIFFFFNMRQTIERYPGIRLLFETTLDSRGRESGGLNACFFLF